MKEKREQVIEDEATFIIDDGKKSSFWRHYRGE